MMPLTVSRRAAGLHGCIETFVFALAALLALTSTGTRAQGLAINSSGYYESDGVNVMVFDDFYPEGHQGGVSIIQRGVRTAANGDLRLEPTPGQWAPTPVMGQRTIDAKSGSIRVHLWYPDSSKNRRGFNPLIYPDLRFQYMIRTEAKGESILLSVDLDEPLPEEWRGKVGFNLEFFPGELFGEHYLMDGTPGVFPRQANGGVVRDARGKDTLLPLAAGTTIVVAPAHPDKELKIESLGGPLQLYDERVQHANGWFVVRSPITTSDPRGAVRWVVTPRPSPGWRSAPIIHVSEVGYRPDQRKLAVIELDKKTERVMPTRLFRLVRGGTVLVKTDSTSGFWGPFLRSQNVQMDFSDVTEEGIYRIAYGDVLSDEFEIRQNIFARDVWQPTLECFLPVQMCHVRIEDGYRVWHGICHMDDARMAPTRYNQFDGYFQGDSTLTRFAPGEHVPGLNAGGWHDAGDYDLRLESQTETIYKLALAYEMFGLTLDETSVDQERRVVRLHVPDGVPDVLQQVEHGLLSVVGAYESMGRLYRGIICPTLHQYVHLGDGSTSTDNLTYTPGATDPVLHRALPEDDGYVFTEINPRRELSAAQALAGAARVLKTFRPDLAARTLAAAEALFAANVLTPGDEMIDAAAELFLTTLRPSYRDMVIGQGQEIAGHIERHAEVIGRFTRRLNDSAWTALMTGGAVRAWVDVARLEKLNPYHVPYAPHIWGAGWDIQSAGVRYLFLHQAFPDAFPPDPMLDALNFVLGCHPGANSSSFASGVGSRSITTAYGVNRADWSYIPGGIASGTALIRPDLPELKTWPFFWQQTEYVLGGGTADYLLLALAADRVGRQR